MAFRSRNAHYKLKDIDPRYFYSIAKKLGLAGEVDSIIEEILVATLKVINSVWAMLPTEFPQHVADAIFTGLTESANKIQKVV